MTTKGSLFLILLLVFCFTAPVFANSVKADSGLTEIDVSKNWPAKANWVGQKTVFYMSKIYSKVSFLSVYEDPLRPMAGIDQMFLSRKLTNKKFIISGLYELKQGEYYWYLRSESGGPAVWVRDYEYKPLAEMPFSLPEEIEKDVRDRDSLQSRVGTVVWYNGNSAVLGEEVKHLEELTVEKILSEEPFSETYSIVFKQEDGTLIEWKSGATTNPPVYNHADLGNVLKESFYEKSPYDTYSTWKQQDWAMIINREVHKDWPKAKVMVSWGKPNQIEKVKSVERWTYNDKKQGKIILCFTKDVVTKILVPKKVKVVEESSLKKVSNSDKSTQVVAKKKTEVVAKKKAEVKDEFENYEEVVVVVRKYCGSNGLGRLAGGTTVKIVGLNR